MTAAVCDRSDLPAVMCWHCRGHEAAAALLVPDDTTMRPEPAPPPGSVVIVPDYVEAAPSVAVTRAPAAAPPEVNLVGRAPCALCAQPHRVGGLLCWDHHRDVQAALDPANEGDRDLQAPASIPVYWDRLDPAPGCSGQQDRRAPGFHSTPPLNLQVVVMRDDRSRRGPVVDVWYPARAGDGQPDHDKPMHEAGGQPMPIERALANVARGIWDHASLEGPELVNGDITDGGVHGLAAWLLDHIDDITAHPAAAELHQYLAGLQEQLRVATGDPRDPPVGLCIELVRGRGQQQEQEYCEHPLYLPPPKPGVTIAPGEPVLRCRRCRRPYTHLDLLRLQLAGELTEQAS